MTLPDQTSIPHGDRTYPTECAWCGETSAGLIQVEKPRYTTAANGQRVIKRAAIKAPACASHLRTIDRGEC